MRRHLIFASVLLSLILTSVLMSTSLVRSANAQSLGGGGPTPPAISTTGPGVAPIHMGQDDFGRPGKPSRDWNLRQTPIVDAIKRVRDAVVNIHSERSVQGPITEEYLSTAPAQNRINGMGTGIIIDPRGYIITNQHVVEDVNVIRIRLADGTVASARVLARDQESDLALLKIDVNRPLPVMPLGTATDLMVGETVIAIGNAYGYEHTATQGIVSAIGRDVTLNKEVSYKSLIQTDASINPGNSGGPLINIWGELVGVNVAIRAGAQGIGFAIPVETMIRVSGNMLRARGAGRGNPSIGTTGLGLVVRDNLKTPRDDSSTLRTVTVERVDASSPAAKAGLQRGDVLVKIGDVSLASTLDAERALVDGTPGDRIAVILRRGGMEQKVDVVVETVRGSGPAATDLVWRRLGLRMQGMAADDVARTHPQLHGGLLVNDVRAESAASKAGIQRGDILVGLHQWEMLSLENVQFVLNHPDLASFTPLRFYILRAGQVHRGWLQSID
jgi:serine protease Do